MPIDSARIERGIYQTRVTGSISLRELASAQDHLFELWRAAEDPPVIAIIDVRELAALPDADLNSAGVRDLMRRQFEAVRAYVVCGASGRIRTMFPVLTMILRLEIHEAADPDAALTLARALLADDHHESGEA